MIQKQENKSSSSQELVKKAPLSKGKNKSSFYKKRSSKSSPKKGEKKDKKKGKKDEESKKVPPARIYLRATMNNTIMTLENGWGKTLITVSGGNLGPGVKTSRRSSAFTAQRVGQRIATVAKAWDIKKAHLFIKGIGKGRYRGARAIKKTFRRLKVPTITDKTPIPHNGCRPPKGRRL